LALGAATLQHRVVMAPLTRMRAGDGNVPTPLNAQYYAQRATPGGLLIAEATPVSWQGHGHPRVPGIHTAAQVAGWRGVTDAVHARGGVIYLQLWHTGRVSHSSHQPDGGAPVAPSAIAAQGGMAMDRDGRAVPYEVPRALRTDEIPGLVDSFRQAAAHAIAAGFDGVEIHAANGYLIDQFLQSKTNLRTDDYGGSIEKRCRLLCDVVTAVAKVWPSRRVGVRISPNGVFNDMGSPNYREQFLHAAAALDRLDLGYLHVVDGLGFGFHKLGEPMTLADFRGVFRGPIVGNCGYTLETAEAAVQEGLADLIAFGRPYISNPDLVERFANGWPLAAMASMADWYSPTGAKGYTDFPTHRTTS
jgi:N-ethylmaleimide reductase